MLVAYATVINEAFAPAALALARSLVAHDPAAVVYFFCLDDASQKILGEIGPPGSVAVRFPDAATSALLSDDHKRLPISAFCWLMKPLVLGYVMQAEPAVEWCCYLDSDMMAFANPADRLALARDRSVVVTPHAFRYPLFYGTDHLYGAYNAGFMAFRQTAKAKEILKWWLTKCLEHCPPFPEPDAFGDQKYVEQMVDRFRDDISVGFPSLNCAAWNIGQDKVHRHAGSVVWRGHTVIVYHFQGLKLLGGGWTDLYADAFRLSSSVRALIYRPYVSALRAAMRDVGRAGLGTSSLVTNISRKDFLARLAFTLWGRRNIMRW